MTLLVDWLTVASLFLLTLGTGVQARASMAEFRGLLRKTSKSFAELVKVTTTLPGGWRHKAFILATNPIVGTLYVLNKNTTGEEEGAAQLMRFLRLAAVWATLTFGSFLGLVAAVVVLWLAYQ
jgi:hypothetical protein